MAISGSLSAVTASDGTFSAAGALAWLTVTGRTVTLSGVADATQGGTGIAFFTAAGPTQARTYTFPDADATILVAGGAISGTTGTFSSLTATRVPFAGTAGLLGDSANLTFSGSTLSTGTVAVSGTTVPAAGIWSRAVGFLTLTGNSFQVMEISNGSVQLNNGTNFNWSSGNIPTGSDTNLSRISGGLLGVGTGSSDSFAGSLKAKLYQGMMGTGAGIGNMVSTATVNTTAVASTGAGPDILQTYDLPLNSFSAAGKGVHITVWGTSANTAEAKTIILYFGSTAILTNALTASIAGVWRIEADVYSTGTDAQQYVAQLVTTGTAGVALNDVEQGTSTEDDGAAITIKCTGTIGAPSTAAGLVQEGLTVRFIN